MRNDGGSAFPAVEYMAERGMSLRDWFAGQSLSVMAMQAAESGGMWPNRADAESLATAAYTIADAMLAEREKFINPHMAPGQPKP